MKYVKNIWGLMVCVVLAGACGDKDLVKFDNIEGVKNWTPEVNLPLASADYDVWKLVNQYDEDADIALKDGKIVIRRELKDIYTLGVDQFIAFPSDFAQLSARMPLPSPVPSGGTELSYTGTTDINFNQGILKKLKASFRLHYVVPSTAYPFKFTFTLTNAFDEAGNAIGIRDKESAGGVIDDYIDFENVNFDMSAQPNTVAWEIKVALEESTVIPAGDFLNLDFKLENFSFEEAVGNLSAQALTITPSVFDLGVDFWDKLKGDVTLMDPRIDMIVADTGLMLPFSVQMSFNLYGDNHKQQKFEGEPLLFEWQNEIETQVQSYDATNSNIADLIYFPPTHGIEYSGMIRVNPQEKEVTVKNQGKANIGAYIEVPLGLASSDMMFNDTVKCGKVDSDIVDKLLLARIRVSAVNNIPLELGEGSLKLLDDNYHCIDMVEVEKFIDAPVVDASGNVTEAAQSTNLISLSDSNIENLVNTEYIVISVKAATSNKGEVPVEIKPEATLHLNLNLEVRFTFEKF